MKQIKKKSGAIENWDIGKIVKAITKSANRVATSFSDGDLCSIIEEVEKNAKTYEQDIIPVEIVHSYVEMALEKYRPDVAKSYKDYRNWVKREARMNARITKECNAIQFLGDKSNANADSTMVSTKRVKKLDALETAQFEEYFLNANERAAAEEGYIYIHDKGARQDTSNCCLFDIQSVLSGGFEMGNIWYNDPKTLDVAFDVIGDIVLSAASQQYGGFTLPQIDEVLVPYAEKSYQLYLKKYQDECGLSPDKAHDMAYKDVLREMRQGFQGWEYKFNTVASSRGDYPFITVSFGLSTSLWGKELAKAILTVRMNGQGKKGHKKPVLFPKLVFLYDKFLHGKGCPLEDVFETGIQCSAKTMYPDWLSLTGTGYVSSIYKQYGKVVSPMGCVSGDEVITYKVNNTLYVESFERFWNRMSSILPPLLQPCDKGEKKYLYIDLTRKNVSIYDTQKGFVKVKKLIRNLSNSWNTIKMTNGRSWLCTTDHPFEIVDKGVVLAKDLCLGDKVLINSSSYSEESTVVPDDYAWLLGFMLCDGCYQNYSIFGSIAASGEDEIQERFTDCFNKYFLFNVKTVEQHREKHGIYKDLRVIGDGSGKLTQLIKQFTQFFGGVQKNQRHIPNEVFRWNYSAKMSFLAGMIDADGYFIDGKKNKKQRLNTIEIGSVNKELAIQQLYLAQTLGMPAKLYLNHYNKSFPDKIRYQVSFCASSELASFVACEKKKANIYETEKISAFSSYAKIAKIIPETLNQYSYDVETESAHFECSGVYSHNCRAFLSPWYERGGMIPADEDDEPIYVGRSNIGVVSLNLPMILAKARRESKDFYEVLDYYLEMIRQIHLRTYDYLGHMKASMNPLGFCEGGFWGGHLQLDDKIAPVIRNWTASFGITALNELQELYNGHSLVEDGAFAREVMSYINQKIDDFKHEDGYLYALYGTPAESLCSKQVEQFRKEFGIVEHVSDREYVSNSFHCHVTEDLTPIEKQDLEGRFWNTMNGGKIQYIRYHLNYNLEAIRSLVRRAMEMGFYEGVNLSLSYCDDCGHEELNMDVCPVCGSRNLTKIDRMNGYLAYSRVHGDTRLNAGKMAEIAERVSM